MWPCKFIHLMSAFRTTSQIFLNYLAVITNGEICSLLTTLNFIALTTQLHVSKYIYIYSFKLPYFPTYNAHLTYNAHPKLFYIPFEVQITCT